MKPVSPGVRRSVRIAAIGILLIMAFSGLAKIEAAVSGSVSPIDASALWVAIVAEGSVCVMILCGRWKPAFQMTLVFALMGVGVFFVDAGNCRCFGNIVTERRWRLLALGVLGMLGTWGWYCLPAGGWVRPPGHARPSAR